jgi:hypothetical protein
MSVPISGDTIPTFSLPFPLSVGAAGREAARQLLFEAREAMPKTGGLQKLLEGNSWKATPGRQLLEGNSWKATPGRQLLEGMSCHKAAAGYNTSLVWRWAIEGFLGMRASGRAMSGHFVPAPPQRPAARECAPATATRAVHAGRRLHHERRREPGRGGRSGTVQPCGPPVPAAGSGQLLQAWLTGLRAARPGHG